MSTRHLLVNRPTSNQKYRKPISKINSKLSISRPKITSPIQNLNLNEIFGISKFPMHDLKKHYSTIFNRKASYQLANASSSPLSRRHHQYKKKDKKHKQRNSQKTYKLSLGSISNRRSENMRYNEKGLEECESYKNFNGVSTPPDEERAYNGKTSPFSDIIDKDLSSYINEPISKLGKLSIPRKSLYTTEDSYQYSTAESRKQDSYKFSFERNARTPQLPLTPPPCSIYTKIHGISFMRLRNKKFKD